MSKIVEQDCGIAKFYIVIDNEGYPLAQGSRELCDDVMEGKHGRPSWTRKASSKDNSE
jgi:hypothetical protein